MKHITLLYMLLTLSVSSQTISKQVIGPGGSTVDNGTNKLSYTAGEVAVGAMTSEDGSVQLGNGYYPSLDLEALSVENPELHLNLKVFPNPVTEAFYVSHPTATQFKLIITLVNGKQLFTGTHQKGQPFSMQSYRSGIYLISVTTLETNQSNTYKIIKQ
ncbi:MAG: T9SS type A sorting domain-containing protein [Flavobacteriaceae bacterium]|nr:T9SS type A sorting domain-containing protein [Flavobacteriaceae bacterium]MDG1793454.1 T9SS type A sorting domain-containing protein [Flavobacteriaceae bacterium]